jgi:hypothetical protein
MCIHQSRIAYIDVQGNDRNQEKAMDELVVGLYFANERSWMTCKLGFVYVNVFINK